MPLFDSQRGVDAPWLFEARAAGACAGVCESAPRLCGPPSPARKRGLGGAVFASPLRALDDRSS
jgi:hypothetical protein